MPTIPALSLQTRILALFLLLIVVVQVGGFVLVNTAGVTAARTTIGEQLVAGARIFDRLLEQDKQRLAQGARLLSADYAFREAISTGDRNTIDSVLANHSKRADADLMMLVGLDGRVTADTLDVATGNLFGFPRLIARAQAEQPASAMVLLRGQLYQLAIVPVLAPLPIAWVAMGSSVNDAVAKDLNRLTRLQVSFLSRQSGDTWQLQASTLPDGERAALLRDIAAERFAAVDENGNAAFIEHAVTRVVTLPGRSDESVVAVLQEPLDAALEPFRNLQRQLAWISAVAVLVSIVASALIARGVARPVRELANAARRIAGGDYTAAPPKSRTVEIDELATSFQTMQDGIASREFRIMDLAYRDPLTRLPNRALFGDRLDEWLRTAMPGEHAAVLLMDLDHFKFVNETLGHAIGDLLLTDVGALLGTVVNGQQNTVARLGGDEFAVLLPAHGAADAQRAAAAILQALEAPMTLSGHQVDVRASMGIAVYPEHGRDASTLLRHADVAMYAAKANHLGVVVWDGRYAQHGADRLSLMSDLRKAVDNNELMLLYQPKVALGVADGNHVEALVRWQHPTRGLVPPAEFIPFAEQTGFIRAITQWVLAHAVAQCAAWRAEGLQMHVSINLSARDLMDAELPDRFSALLELHGCAARWITLEITESAIFDDIGHAIEGLRRLTALGTKISIDDYGTGYSSLAYLRRLPLHELKIDKSFIMGMTRDASDLVIVRSTIDLAHNMGLVVVAEGVEDEATFDRLRALGCDMAQGYLMSRPVAAAEIAARVRGETWPRAGREGVGLRRVV